MQEIEEHAAKEADLRKIDKLGYRYPRGESYLDLITRLEPVMHEMESYEEPLLIVGHQALLRMVYAYMKGLDRSEATGLDVPLHTVIQLSWGAWQPLQEKRFHLGPDMSAFGDGQKKL